ncbi:uncharacterized protein LOC107043490 [Diachasma alloeum]|uniref:uncharacterized protein LOC107043490 n=1 Tax=Diachasma alloeum TaxID=454923 RepID=UPI0007384A41|nr:uncharacterized protein LOC107043490 [Diachasma alloeum]
MTMIFKKGDREDPANYRGIALGNTMTKLFTEIIRRRLESWVEEAGLLPESQQGFRRGRSYTDAIFSLFTAIHLQLRLDKREVYAVLVDFKKAFDSIPHENLWRKLRDIGVSSKVINILISLYSQANVQIRSQGQLSNMFEVTEGVLQGETLSPLLFLLYISDFESFFRSRGCSGINLNGRSDILMQLFADDAVFLADTHVRLGKILETFHAYCSDQDLAVNTSKNQILTLTKAGIPRRINVNFTKYNGTPLQQVHSYTYLGIRISTTARFKTPAQNAIQKAKAASLSTLAIINRSKCDSWASYLKLFDSMVATTLLYAAPAWAIDAWEDIEVIQTDFFKRLLSLPRGTAHWAVRMESGQTHLALRSMKQT